MMIEITHRTCPTHIHSVSQISGFFLTGFGISVEERGEADRNFLPFQWLHVFYNGEAAFSRKFCLLIQKETALSIRSTKTVVFSNLQSEIDSFFFFFV